MLRKQVEQCIQQYSRDTTLASPSAAEALHMALYILCYYYYCYLDNQVIVTSIHRQLCVFCLHCICCHVAWLCYSM